MMMADIRRLAPNSKLDLQQILDEAKHRWLRPSEILEILKNYQLFQLSTQPPLRPPAGSLFLFDRKALRYFRKDGHRWRKKKDGKTVREAHEKLKAGSVDVLHCYYAHGEDNDNFQRRIYWMLDGNLEHIVLVHYREVNEVYRSRLLPDPGTPQSNSGPSVSQAASPVPIAQTSYGSSPNRIDWSAQSISSEFEDIDSRSGPGASSLALPNLDPMTNTTSLLASEVGGFPVSKSPLGSSLIPTSGQGMRPSLWSEVHGSGKSLFNLYDQKFYAVQSLGAGASLVPDKHTNATLDVESKVLDAMAPIDMLITNPASPATHQSMVQEHDVNMAPPPFHNLFAHQPAVATAQVEKKPKDESNDKKSAELKKLDSFSRWLDKEIGGDCQDSLMASDSKTYWNTLSASNQDREASSLSCHMQLDVDSLGPSLSQEQLFSICDFSPDWAYPGVETKVLIIGTFLGSKELFTETKWGCMFGEIEVFADVLSDNVVRCQAPLHATGRVPFYITCRNRLACSEVREFEFRENSPGITSLSVRSAKEEELHFLVRLAKLLDLSPGRMGLSCPGCDRCIFRSNLNSIRNGDKKDPVRVGDKCHDPRDKVIQSLLEDRLCEWLMYKVHEGGKGPDVLDDEGQGVIHLAAGLGYDLVLGLIVAASGNPNFRDSRGRTALHWASYFGREETVIELLRLGVDPTAVDDPTASSPGGQTAADIASSQGRKGLAGYLAEAFLSRHLSSLSSKQNVADSADADETIAAEHATEIAALLAVQSNEGVNEQLSLKGSLAAVRKSAHAAALIQAAYRAKSFCHRLLPKSTDVVSEVSFDLAALGSLSSVQKRGHHEDYLHSAAVKIQQKYRGWKGRKEFLKIRNRIVKIQAHVRGRQVRKQYKKVVWSVGIVEKAILRWRRKGAGLRGFRIEKTIGDGQRESEKSDEYEFLRISRRQKVAGVEKALERVKSMVRNPAARDQYMRLVNRFETLKMSGEGSSSEASSQTDR